MSFDSNDLSVGRDWRKDTNKIVDKKSRINSPFEAMSQQPIKDKYIKPAFASNQVTTIDTNYADPQNQSFEESQKPRKSMKSFSNNPM